MKVIGESPRQVNIKDFDTDSFDGYKLKKLSLQFESLADIDLFVEKLNTKDGRKELKDFFLIHRGCFTNPKL